MRLTNKLNLPQPLVSAIMNDPYSKGNAKRSVSQLNNSPRVVALTEAHQDEITEDASDRIFSLLGQLTHSLLERANTTGIAERRLSTEVEGWKISGGMDAYYEDGLLQDYKLTTSWKFKNGMAPPEFISQLNMYAEILRENGHKVTRLEIVGILRDFSKLEAARDPSYPQTQVVIIPVPLWTPEEAKRYLRERVILHQQALVSLPLCTREERWAKDDVYAVHKTGRKSAVKLYDNESDAADHAATSSELYVEKRPGVSTRCRFYCGCLPFCLQGQALTGGPGVSADIESEVVAL